MNSSKFIVLAVAITRRAPSTKIYNVDYCVCFSLNKYYGIYLGLELGMVSCTFFSFEIKGLLIFYRVHDLFFSEVRSFLPKVTKS